MVYVCSKLIGAKHYNKGYQALYGKLNASMNSACDHNGHGSHTLSIAGGNFVPNVSFNRVWMGTAKGGSPRARVAAYKVCWPPSSIGAQCDIADILKGFETAIHDGADVISASLGGDPIDYKDDSLAIASFHAVMKGITVVFSAGNYGPEPGTVSNVAPWVITVGASTIDHEFQSFLHLANGLHLKGLSKPKPLPHSGFYTLINAANAKVENATMMDAMLCDQDALDPQKVKGKILVCLNGRLDRDSKGINALLAGAAGMIVCNDEASGDNIVADTYVLPAIYITYADGVRLYAYLNSTNSALGRIIYPVPAIDIEPAPLLGNFSSRGPNSITPEILKPDITAPGVNIIAAFSEDVQPVVPYSTLLPYNILSGTSMSCPHVAGVVGLLKSVHPDWSPAAIKSAIMTTASIRDNRGHPMMNETKKEADPFSRGAGEINPNQAINPGLVYNLTVNDYLDFLCTRGYNKTIIQKFSGQPYKCPRKSSILDFNYPSITVHKLKGTVTVTRRLTNVGPPSTYTVHVKSPAGISVDVKPNILAFGKKGEEQKFELTMKADGTRVIKGHVFGELVWSNGKYLHVKSPIVVSVA
ncbi:subtilisin-like protease SBT5.4 [Bidens hawaiensis]|uniref:subtilisin-like protease SBT5.4 n=1 Tax=Bidens hawaiensis TaxID=980011 RepID=UPI00404989D0